MGFETEAIERIQTGPPDSKANNAFITLPAPYLVTFLEEYYAVVNLIKALQS